MVIRKFSLALLLAAVVGLPGFTFAQTTGLIVDCNYPAYTDTGDPIDLQGNPIADTDYNRAKYCDFTDVANQVNTVVNFIAFQIIPLIAVGFVIWAGFLYLTSGDNAGKRKQANGILTNVVIGAAIFYLAFLVIAVVINTLGIKDGFNAFQIEEDQTLNPNP